MKYINKFESNYKPDSKYKEGDYIMSIKSVRKGIINEIQYSSDDEGYRYILEEYKNLYFLENGVRLMTPEEIELFKMSKLTNKFNI